MVSTLIRSATYLLEPVGLAWALMLAGAGWAAWKRQWRSSGFFLAVALFMSLIGSTSIPGWLLANLERQGLRPSLEAIPSADAVVSLGGSVQPSRYEANGLDLTAAGDRIIMALELMRQGKAPALVIGGASHLFNGTERVEADLVRQWLQNWKIPAGPIHSLGGCANTHEEAEKVAALARQHGWKKVLLVTSAYHLPRASATFRKAGVAVEGVPCDFQTMVSIETPSSYTLVPRYQGFLKTSLFVHEQIGWAVYRWRGWL